MLFMKPVAQCFLSFNVRRSKLLMTKVKVGTIATKHSANFPDFIDSLTFVILFDETADCVAFVAFLRHLLDRLPSSAHLGLVSFGSEITIYDIHSFVFPGNFF